MKQLVVGDKVKSLRSGEIYTIKEVKMLNGITYYFVGEVYYAFTDYELRDYPKID